MFKFPSRYKLSHNSSILSRCLPTAGQLYPTPTPVLCKLSLSDLWASGEDVSDILKEKFFHVYCSTLELCLKPQVYQAQKGQEKSCLPKLSRQNGQLSRYGA